MYLECLSAFQFTVDSVDSTCEYLNINKTRQHIICLDNKMKVNSNRGQLFNINQDNLLL